MPVTTRRRTQLPEEVASYVREMIFSGQAKPGEFLRMEPIAEAVGVSNTPVREGLLALRSEGLLELVPRRGFLVVAFTRQDIRDLFWAQGQLAGELGARAAKKVTPEILSRLEQLLTESVEASDIDVISDAAHRFHREINLAADSRRLALLLGSMVNQLPWSFYAGIDSGGKGAEEHTATFEALRRKDARKARSVTEQHIVARADILIKRLENQGYWND